MKKFMKKRKLLERIEKSELRDQTDIYRLEEITIQNILSKIENYICNNNNY